MLPVPIQVLTIWQKRPPNESRQHDQSTLSRTTLAESDGIYQPGISDSRPMQAHIKAQFAVRGTFPNVIAATHRHKGTIPPSICLRQPSAFSAHQCANPPWCTHATVYCCGEVGGSTHNLYILTNSMGNRLEAGDGSLWLASWWLINSLIVRLLIPWWALSTCSSCLHFQTRQLQFLVGQTTFHFSLCVD